MDDGCCSCCSRQQLLSQGGQLFAHRSVRAFLPIPEDARRQSIAQRVLGAGNVLKGKATIICVGNIPHLLGRAPVVVLQFARSGVPAHLFHDRFAIPLYDNGQQARGMLAVVLFVVTSGRWIVFMISKVSS